MRHRLLTVIAVASLFACDETGKAPATTPAGSASAQGAPSASAAPAQPWFVGRWDGTYDARHFLIEMTRKQGRVRQWEEDDGKQASGEGKITVTIDADGNAEGSASGPLGKLNAVGTLEEDRLSLRLKPEETDVDGGKLFHGFLLADRKKGEEDLKGVLQASSGDGYTVRDAPVVLEKQSAESAPTK